MNMKGKLLAIGAAILAFVAFFLGAASSKSKTASNYRNKVQDKEAILHKEAANEAFASANKHIQKAKDIRVKREAESSADEDEAIMKWNDDKF